MPTVNRGLSTVQWENSTDLCWKSIQPGFQHEFVLFPHGAARGKGIMGSARPAMFRRGTVVMQHLYETRNARRYLAVG